jgi:hypothetical protein
MCSTLIRVLFKVVSASMLAWVLIFNSIEEALFLLICHFNSFENCTLARLSNIIINMGLFVIGSLRASEHPLDLWSKHYNLLDHSLPQYTHWKLGRSLSPFNGVTHDEKICSRSSLYSLGVTHCFMNQVEFNFT